MRRATPPEVGFVWHFPFVDAGTDQIPRTGIDTMVARAPWAALQPDAGRFDLSALDRQLDAARAGGYRLALLLEANPFCAPAWVARAVDDAGQSARDLRGGVAGLGPHGTVPQAESPVFVAAQRRFIAAVAGHLRRHDPQRTVAAYIPGIEWWFPYTWRYAPADTERFRRWLERRYPDIDALNRTWGSRFPTFDAIEPPRFDVVDLYQSGRPGLAKLHPLGALPGDNPAAAAYDFCRFWEEAAGRAIEGFAARVKAQDPSRPTWCWLTNAYAGGTEWDYVQWSSVAVDAVAGQARSVDVLGLQLAASYGDPVRIALGLDLARKYRKPLCVLDLLDFSLGVAAGPEAMLRATHTAIQHGARAWFYCCWNGAKDFNFHPDWPVDALRAMVDEGKSARAFTGGALPDVRGAILNPYVPTVATPWIDAGGPHSFVGWYRLLGRAGEAVDVVTPRELAQNPGMLRRYAFVVAPDCPVLDARALDALRRYARRGRLLLGGRTPTMDPHRRPLPDCLPTAGARVVRLRDFGAAWTGDPVRRRDAGDTPPLFVLPQTGGDDGLRALRDALARLGVPPRTLTVAGPDRFARTDFDGGRGVYLVNAGAGPVDGVRVDGAARVDLWIDGTVRRGVAAERGLTLPPFSRAAIVRAS